VFVGGGGISRVCKTRTDQESPTTRALEMKKKATLSPERERVVRKWER